MVQNDAIHTSEDYVNYTFNISSKGVGEVTGELLGLSNTVSVILGDIAFKTAEMLSHTETLAIGTGAAVGALFASATKDAIRFEQQMANVKAIGGESLNVKDIGSAAMEYSNKFGMATASMTEGLEALARAGITTTSVMKGVLEEGVKLSKLEGMDLEDSINDLISTTNLLSVENVDMNDAQYADMVKQMNQHIVSTSESAPINAQNIIQSLQHVGGYASASGMDQDDLFAVIAQLGSRGTKGEMAGTALRAFIAAGQKDTAQRALARIGLNVRDLWDEDGNTMLSISEMKNVLDNALEARGYSKQEKLEFYSDFAGYKQANQIMKIDTTEVEHYKEQIANAWDLGHKLDTILGTVRGNLDRIWQITQNFMTKVGSKFLFIANAILTPVRMLLELINKMPFADTAVAVGMIIIGFSGMLKIINNIVPRFSGFFIQLSQSKKDALSIRGVWKKLPEDISKAKDTLAAMKDPQEMLAIQQQRQLYGKKEMEIVENRLGRVFYVESQWDDERLSDMNKEQKQEYLKNMWDQADNPARQTFINQLKVQDPEKWEKAVNDYMSRTIAHANDAASQVSYDIGDIVTNDKLTSIDRYVAWIWGFISGAPESSNDSDNTPPDASSTTTDNRQRNARINDFKNIRDSIFENKGDYGDYSYHVNPTTGMRQFEYNNINAMREFEEQVKQEIERKERMYLDFLNDKDIIGGRNRLKKSLTIGAKTDLGYEFSTGANTADIKHILETGHIRSNSSKILDEQLQTIADALGASITGDTNADMEHFYRVLQTKENKDELLESILDKTQVQWNDKYYNSGRVGFFATNALKQASDGVTARKIMDKVGVNSVREVQEHFKNVDLDDALLNECVDIMYEDKELVKTLVDEEIKYMYENLARVQNSLERASNGGAGFSSKGESLSSDDILMNRFSALLNKEALTKDNMGVKLQDLLMNGAISVDPRYKSGALGATNSDDMIDINTGTIRYHTDNYHNEYGDYANALLDTVLHEMTHVLMMHQERLNYHNNNIPSELGIDNFKTSQLIHGYDEHFVAEYEAQYVSSQVLSRLGIETSEKNQKRMAAFKDVIEQKGYGDQIQYEILDSLVDEMLNNISIIGKITGDLSTQINRTAADITIPQIYEEMRPIMTKIQAFNKDAAIYQGPAPGNKKDEVDQILSDMAQDMNKLQLDLSKPTDLSRIYNVIAQKYTPYIESLNDIYDFDTYFKYALRKSNLPVIVDDFKNEGNIENIWNKAADATDLSVLSAIKKYQLADPNIQKNAHIFYGTWGDKRFNSHINEFLRREISDFTLKDERDYISSEMEDVLTEYDITTISSLSNILSQTLLQTQGLPFMTRLYRRGALNTSDSGFGILTGVTSTAYDSRDTNAYKNGYGDDLIEILAPAGTQGMNLYDWEYTLAPNTPYIEIGQHNEGKRILLLPPKQQFKYGFYPEGLDDTFRVGISAAIANSGGLFEDIDYDMDGIKFEEYLYDNESIARGLGDDGMYHYYNIDNDTILTSDWLFDLAEDIDEQFINANNAILSNFGKMGYSKSLAQEIISNFIRNHHMYQENSNSFKSKGENVDNIIQDLVNEHGVDIVQKAIDNATQMLNIPKKEYNYISEIIHDSVAHFKENKTKNLSIDNLYEYIKETYDKSTAIEAKKWLEWVKTQDNKDAIFKKNETLRLSKDALETYENYSDPTRIPGEPEKIKLPDSGKIIELPTHSAGPSQIKRGGMKKYLLKRTSKDIRNFEGILDLLNSDFVRNLSPRDLYTIHKAISQGEGAGWEKRKNLLQGDKKVGTFGVVNVSTAADCVNRGDNPEEAMCKLCDVCYAWIQAFKPNVAKMQIDRSIFFRENTAEQISEYLQKTPYEVIRISQEGDFRTVEDFEKVAKIAELNPDRRFYGYTKVQEVLNFIEDNLETLPKNLQINNSLGTWETGNYVAAHWSEIIDYLEKDYQLCQGACDSCKQCLHNINKVTILRDGGHPLTVDDISHLTRDGQKEVFKILQDYEKQGIKVNEDKAKEVIDNISQISDFVKPIQGQTTFQSAGEEGDKRLPELMDWTNILAEHGNVPGIGYGASKDNMLDFLTTFHDKIISEDNFRQREGKKPLPKGYSGDRMVLSGKEFFDSEFNISSVKSRLENFGIYWNKKSAKEAEETGMEELINLFDKEAVKEALMREIITTNQLKKWHKQLQNSRAIEKYGGYIPWTLEDVEDWDTQKRASDTHLQALIEQRKQQKNTSNTQSKNIEWGMPGLHYDAYSGFKNGKKQFDKNREQQEEYIKQFYQSIDSNNVNKLDETLSKLAMFSDSYSDYRTVLYRINGLDERQGLSSQGITSLENLLIPDLRNTNAMSILADGTFLNDEKLNAYKEKVRKENEYKKRIKHNIGEDNTSTLNTPFVMNDEIRKWVEKDYEPSQTVSENVKKSTSSQTTLDDFATPSDNPSRKEEREKNQNIRKLLNSLVINQGQRGIIQKLLIEGRSKDIVKEIQKANRDTSEEDIVDVVKYLINSPAKLNDIKINPEEFSDTPETPSSSLYEQHEKYIHNPELNKQNQEKNNVFVEYNYWEKLRQRVSQALNFAPPGTEDKQNKTEKKAQKTIFSLIDLGEKGENFTASILGNLAQKMNNGKTYDGDVFEDTSKSFSKMIGPAKEFASILDRLSEDFVFLTPIAEGFNTAVNGADTAVDALTAMSQFLGVVREDKEALDDLKKESKDNPYAKILYSITKLKDSKTILGQNAWALIQSATSKVNSYIGATLIPMLPTLVPLLLPIIAIIGAVIVAIKAVQFWEKKHAQALKESQEALKEATAKTSTALSQYKDFHKARERETDIIKKQQAARKEAIALYELEIARLNQQKAVKKESDIRNDKVWGEYGRRAEHQKMSWTNAILLGPFAMISKWLSGDFEPQYENYDGTTKNIRQIKESTLGSILPPTGAKGKVARIYDDNKLFFSMVEAYQKPLIDLYNKESKLIEQYGSLDNARASEEFYNAVQEFADATGIQGETAGKMLDWLETENKVNQATQAMQAQVNLITSKAHAEAMAAEYNDVDFASDDLRNAMIYAQADQLYKDAYNEMWWEWFSATLFGILYTIINAMSFGLAYGKERKEYEQKQKAYSEAMKELQEMGVQGLAEIGENTAEHADRRNYGTSTSLYYDTPFGAAQESAALQYAEEQQQIAFNQNHTVYSENEYRAIQENYINYGPEADMELHDIVKREKEYVHQESEDLQKSLNQDMTKAGQAGVDGFKEGLDQHSPGLISRSVQDEMIYSNNFIIEATPQLSESTHDLGSEMSDSHKDALAISDNTQQEMVNVNDTIKDSKDTINPTAYDAGYEAGQEYGKGFKEGLKDLFAQISSPEALEQTLEDRILVRQGYGTPKGADPNDPEVQKKQEERRIETESKLLARGFSLPSFSTFAKNEGIAAYRVAKGGGLRSWKDTSVIGRIANAAEIGLTEGSLSKGLKALFAPKYGEEFGIKGAKHAINKALGREAGEAVASAPTGKVVGAVDDTLGKVGAKGGKYVEKGLSKLGIEGGESLAETGGKFVARYFGDDVAKLAIKGGSKLAKMGSKALPFVGTAITAATSIMEHNPFEKHYNEDGSEKRALQSTGEVAGEITGALASDVVGIIAGPVAGMAAGLILEPIGEAIGGTIGWMADEVVNTKFTDAWAGFNDALGGIPGQLVDFIDQSPIGQAGHWAFDQIDNLTGGWLGDTWEYVKNSSIAELTGLDQLGGALQGMGEWLFGSGEDKQEQLPAPDQITDEQIAELENAGMLDEYLASYGLDKEQKNILNKDKTQKIQPMGNGSTVIIKNININTEDDPEKIKSALMNLIIEMQEQINPRQVSRTVGEPPATQSTSTDQNQNNTAQAQGTDPQSGTNNNTNPNMSPNTNT